MRPPGLVASPDHLPSGASGRERLRAGSASFQLGGVASTGTAASAYFASGVKLECGACGAMYMYHGCASSASKLRRKLTAESPMGVV